MKIKFLFLQLFLLASLCLHAQDQTILIATATNYSTQTWFYCQHGQPMDTQKIKEKYNEGYYITSVSYTGKGWFVSLSKNCGFTSQSYYYTHAWPKDWLNEKMGQGYYISSIASGDGNWMIVVSKGTGYTGQTWDWDTWENLDGFLHKYWKLGYSITDIEFSNGKWLLVMSANSPYKEQSCAFRQSRSEALAKVDEYFAAGKRLQLIEYGNGKYFILASKFKNGSLPSQSCSINSSDVKAWISEQWEKGRDVTYIGGGYKTQAKTTQSNTTTYANNNHNNYNRNSGKTVVVDGKVPYLNGTSRIVVYSDGSGYTEDDIPCPSYHCRNGYCTMCNGTGMFVHPMVNFTSYCTVCNMGRCKMCQGKGRIQTSKNWAPGEAEAYLKAVRQLKNAGHHVPEERINRKSGGVCPDCNGKGYRPQPYQYAATSMFAPYHNLSGNNCPICDAVTDHYHYRCTTCKKF